MEIGAVTQYIDVAQLTLYAFWLFFAGLVIYLRMEDKREGYPLVTERPGVYLEGFPPMPAPKTFTLIHNQGTVTVPRQVEEWKDIEYKATPVAAWPGAPIEPVGPNKMLSGAGPSAYAMRFDTPEPTFETGEPRIAPMRIATDHAFDEDGPSPIGFDVVGFDGVAAGKITDAWVDREESLVRYLEAKLTNDKSVLIPMPLCRVRETTGQVLLASVTGEQVLEAPTLADPDQVTLREEDRVAAYFASGHLYAKASRQEPIL
jgi:photosynthetic reaction center H subunit